MTTATKIVRSVMKRYGHSNIWTNKLTCTLTVKCYKSGDEVKDTRMINDIAKALAEAGVKNPAVRMTDGRRSYHRMGAIIIEVPWKNC